jgi:ribose 5-phosphate isomerase B
MRLALGCDDAAFGLAQVIRRHLETNAPVAVSVMDFGAFDAELCGTGIGVAIAANKVPGVRAACCHDTYSAERSRASNDAQILTMGARVVGPELALRILDTWLQTEFGGGPSASKVAKITAIERRFMVDPAPRPLQGEDPAP